MVLKVEYSCESPRASRHRVILDDIVLSICQVDDLCLEAQAAFLELEFPPKGSGMLVVPIYFIGWDVLSQIVSLAYHRYGIAHIHPWHLEGSRYIAIVLRGIRQLNTPWV